MALSKIVENSISDGAVAAAKLKDFAAAVDLNGVELILDADQDTSITADTDDRIDFKIANVEHFSFSNSSGDTVVKPMVDGKDIIFQQYDGNKILEINDGNFVGVGGNSSAPGEIRIYEDTDNGSHYTGFKAGNNTASVSYVLPTADGSASQALITDGSGTLSWSTISTAYDDLTAGDSALNITTTAGNITIDAQGSDTDIIFKGTDGGADRTYMTIDGSAGGDLFLTGGLIDLKNDGSAVSQIKFYCESSNAHAQTLIGAPHSESATNTLTLPSTGGDSYLVSASSTATLTNKTLTAPTLTGTTVAASFDISGDIDVDGTTNLDAVDIDGAVQLDATLTVGANDQGYDVILYGDTASANLTWDTSADDLILNGAAGLVVPDGQLTLGSTAVTSTAAELNLLDGVSGLVQADFTKLAAIDATATEINKLDGVGTLLEAGKHTIWVPANAMTPTASNGCSILTTVETTSGRPDMNVLDFDKDSDEFAQFSVAFPKSWNAGTITFQFFWSGIAATTGVAMSLQGVSFADNDSIDTAYGTAVVVQDDAQGAVEELLVSAESGAVTIAGSPGDNELCYFRIGRDVSDANDDMAGDCRLHGVKLFYTTDASNDA